MKREPTSSRIRQVIRLATPFALTFHSPPRLRLPVISDDPPSGNRSDVDGVRVVLGCAVVWGLPQSVHHHTTVTAFTDGSLANGCAAWAVCFENQWLRDSYHSLPLEDALTVDHFRGAVVGGAVLDVNEGSSVFDAELQAILRALLAPHITCSLHIVTDSRSAIDAISSYQSHMSSRSRLRMVVHNCCT